MTSAHKRLNEMQDMSGSCSYKIPKLSHSAKSSEENAAVERIYEQNVTEHIAIQTNKVPSNINRFLSNNAMQLNFWLSPHESDAFMQFANDSRKKWLDVCLERTAWEENTSESLFQDGLNRCKLLSAWAGHNPVHILYAFYELMQNMSKDGNRVWNWPNFVVSDNSTESDNFMTKVYFVFHGCKMHSKTFFKTQREAEAYCALLVLKEIGLNEDQVKIIPKENKKKLHRNITESPIDPAKVAYIEFSNNCRQVWGKNPHYEEEKIGSLFENGISEDSIMSSWLGCNPVDILFKWFQWMVNNSKECAGVWIWPRFVENNTSHLPGVTKWKSNFVFHGCEIRSSTLLTNKSKANAYCALLVLKLTCYNDVQAYIDKKVSSVNIPERLVVDKHILCFEFQTRAFALKFAQIMKKTEKCISNYTLAKTQNIIKLVCVSSYAENKIRALGQGHFSTFSLKLL